MAVLAEPETRYDYWRPPGTGPLAGAVRLLDTLFDRVYASRYNPLYRTGTLAALCLTIAIVSGVYLLFVYEIGRPWESVQAIQSDPWLGRWIRALHRYASDAAVVAVALHVLRLFIQGKTWGPRMLAWITGLLLAAFMLLSAVTGFVLVWDQFAQRLAVVGAKILRLLPLFPEPPDRAFVGERPVPSAFFFMNLFLHVAVPLGMIGFLWLHTSRLARAAWFPERKVVAGTIAGLVVLAIAWPAPLPPAADLLAIPGRVPSDWFYAFWIPLAEGSPVAGLALASLLVGLLVAVPWLVRPRAARRAPAAWSDPDKCEGCRQCVQDCPYDAIEMVTGKHPERHPLRAEVTTDRCVSCGVCAAACASLAIGPPSRTALDQLAAARHLVASTPAAGDKTLVVACRNNGAVAARVRARGDGGSAVFEVDCAGTLHPSAVAYLGARFARTVVLACPTQNCIHRDGPMLTEARILLERRPAVPGRIDRGAVRLHNYSEGEWRRIVSAISGTEAAAAGDAARRGWLRTVATLAFSAALLGLLAAGSALPQGAEVDHALLRLGWRLAGQVNERCRDLTPDEIASRPVHMRTPRECTREVLAYELEAVVDGAVVAHKPVKSPGLRADRPLSVEEDLELAPGEHAVTVAFRPVDRASGGLVLRFDGTLRFDRGRVVLITLDNDRLVAK